MPIVEYRTIKVPYYLQDLATIIALFIPLPTEKYTPDFAIFEYGFASTIAITNLRIPLMWFVVLIAIIF
jgi:hypothetical protein